MIVVITAYNSQLLCGFFVLQNNVPNCGVFCICKFHVYYFMIQNFIVISVG